MISWVNWFLLVKKQIYIYIYSLRQTWIVIHYNINNFVFDSSCRSYFVFFYRLQRQVKSKVIIDSHTTMSSSIFSGVRVVATHEFLLGFGFFRRYTWLIFHFTPLWFYWMLCFLSSNYFRISFRLILVRSVF